MLSTEPRRGKLYKGKKACSLSAGLRRNPSLFDGKKLSLVGLDIHFIDILPLKIAESVKTIYLSNNYLVNLANMEQFSKVESASIMNNGIRYLDELQTLSRLKNLKSLSLQGNVVSKMPFYREHVVCMCPALTLLDDEKVTADYREKCQSKLLVISTFYDYLRVNELRNGVLVHICKLMECHVEIFGEFGKGGCFSHGLQAHVKDAAPLDSGAGAILQVALQGGVFCWLQRMDCRYFNRLVQDNLYGLLVEYLRRNPAPSQQQQGAEGLSQLWQGLVEVYKKDQFDFYSQIIAFCALLRSGSGGGGSSSGRAGDAAAEEAEAAQDRVRADHCLCRMQLLSTPCPAQCALRHDSDRWKPSTTEQHQQRQQVCLLQQYQAGHSHQHLQQQHQQQQQQQRREAELSAPPPPPPPLPLVEQGSSSAAKLTKRSTENAEKQGSKAWMLVQRLNRSPADYPATAVAAPVSDVYSRILEQSKQQQELRGLTKDGALHQSRAELLSSASGLAEERLVAASRSEHISERYEQLLHQHQHTQRAPSTSHKNSSSTSPTSRPSNAWGGDAEHDAAPMSSRSLPPQQREPQSPHPAPKHKGSLDSQQQGRYEPLSQSDAPSPLLDESPHFSTHPAAPSERAARAAASVFAAASNGGLEGKSVVSFAATSPRDDVGADEEELASALSGDIEDFLQRVLRPGNPGEVSDAVGAADVSKIQELETQFLLAAESIQAHMASSAQAEEMRSSRALRASAAAEASAAAGGGGSAIRAELVQAEGAGNMRALRTHIDKTMFDHLRRTERNNAIVFMLHRSLLATASKLQEQALAVSDAGLKHLSVRLEEVRGVKKDIRYGMVCLQVHEKSIEQMEDVHGRIGQQRAKEQSASEQLARLRDFLVEQSERRAALEKELAKSDISIIAAREEERLDASVQAAKRSERHEQLVAAFYPVSLACCSLKAHMLHKLRARTTRQRKIRSFYHAHCREKERALKLEILSAWKAIVGVARRGLRLQRWKDKSAKQDAFHYWRQRHRLSSIVQPAASRTACRRALRKSFEAFLQAWRRRRVQSEVDERHALYVTLFRSIRAFRAWKDFTVEAAAQNRRRLALARTRTLQKIFDAWGSVALQGTLELQAKMLSVQRTYLNRTMSAALGVWLNLLHYRSELGLYRRKKRAFAILLRHISSRCRQRKLHDMAAVVASSPHGLMRGKLLVAWKRWHLRTARIKHVRRVAQLLRKRTNDQAEYRAWLAWRAHSKHRLALDRKHYRLAARCGGRTLRLHFTKWKAAAARRKALVPHIRERWLHLFSDSHHEQERSHPSNNINGSLPQCGPAPAVAAGAGRATGGSNRFRQSLNNLELQLLYWDDDDDDDGREGANGEPSSSGRAGTAGGNDGSGGSGATAAEEEEEGNDAGARAVEHALTHAVLLRRYVTRWRDRAWRASSLQLKASAVRRLSLRCCARSSFSVMLCLHGRAMLQKHKECQYFLSRNANGVEVTEQLALTGQNNEAAELHARRTEIEALARSDEKQQRELRELADSLALDLAAREQQLAGQAGCLQDASASIEALQAEKTGLDRRLDDMKQYIQSAAAKRDEYAAASALTAEQSSHLPSLLARLASSTTDGAGGASSEDGTLAARGEALTVVEESCSADERLALMQDVEALYRSAVATQESMHRKKQHLENQRQAAQALLDQRRVVAQELDGQIEALQAERSLAEHALLVCQTSLQESFSKVAEQTKDHEAHLTALEGEEKVLKERLQWLAAQERALTQRVEALQVQRERRGQHSLSSSSNSAHPEPPAVQEDAARRHPSSHVSPRSLGAREALMAEHLTHITGATGSSFRLRKPAANSTATGAAGHTTIRSGKEVSMKPPLSVQKLGVGLGKENKKISAGALATGISRVSSAAKAIRVITTTPPGGESAGRRDTPAVAPPSPAPSPPLPQEDIDKQIEALSLRIRQRLTTV